MQHYYTEATRGLLRMVRNWERKQGKALIVGGSRTNHGSLYFVTESSLIGGLERVYVATPYRMSISIRAMLPEALVITLPDLKFTLGSASKLLKWMPAVDAVLTGAGIGPSALEGLRRFIPELKLKGIPLILFGEAVFRELLPIVKGHKCVVVVGARDIGALERDILKEEPARRVNLIERLGAEQGNVFALIDQIVAVADASSVRILTKDCRYSNIYGASEIATGLMLSFVARGIDIPEAVEMALEVFVRACEAEYEAKGIFTKASNLLLRVEELLIELKKSGAP